MDNTVCFYQRQPGVCIFAICFFVVKCPICSDSLPKLCLVMLNVWPREDMNHRSQLVWVHLTACSNVLKRKSAGSGMRLKKRGKLWGKRWAAERSWRSAPGPQREHCVWQHDALAQTTEMSRALLSSYTVSTFNHSPNKYQLKICGMSTTELTWACLGFNGRDHYKCVYRRFSI